MQHGARRHDATGRANQQVGQFGSAAHRAPEMIEQWRRGHREANEPLDPPLATQRASAGVVVCRQRSPRRVGMWCTQGVHGMLHQQFAGGAGVFRTAAASCTPSFNAVAMRSPSSAGGAGGPIADEAAASVAPCGERVAGSRPGDVVGTNCVALSVVGDGAAGPTGKNEFARFTAAGSIFSHSLSSSLAFGSGQARR